MSVAKKGTDVARSLGKDFLDKQIDKFYKEYITGEGSGITLTKYEIKDIMKVIKSLENRGILLKGNTWKTTGQERGFLNFLRPLITAGLPSMKNVLTTSAKSTLILFRLTAAAAAAATDVAI